MIFKITPPLLLVGPTEDWQSSRTHFARLLVPMDGSEVAEEAIPFVHALGAAFGSEVVFFSAPEGNESAAYQDSLRQYLDRFVRRLSEMGVRSRAVVGSGDQAPSAAIVAAACAERTDCIVLVSHGRGGKERMGKVRLGSVADRVVSETPCPVFFVSAGSGVRVDPSTVEAASATVEVPRGEAPRPGGDR